jgi:predicted thioesterase
MLDSGVAIHEYEVRPEDTPKFNDQQVHPVCSTYALAREIEWTTRQFVIQLKQEDEEGIGNMLSIEHRSPARVGDKLMIRAKIRHNINNEIICDYVVRVGDKVIAYGMTGQKILKKSSLKKLFETK